MGRFDDEIYGDYYKQIVVSICWYIIVVLKGFVEFKCDFLRFVEKNIESFENYLVQFVYEFVCDFVFMDIEL